MTCCGRKMRVKALIEELNSGSLLFGGTGLTPAQRRMLEGAVELTETEEDEEQEEGVRWMTASARGYPY